MDRFRDKYRIPSVRLKGWDYATPGYYFVTICCAGHEAFFGQVVEGEVHLSKIGEIVAEEWVRTEQIRPNVTLDEWVIMPNHMHGIIVINDVVVETPAVETPRRGSLHPQGCLYHRQT